MCGFAGYLTSTPGDQGTQLAALQRMIGTIRHRGPDDAGTWADPDTGIALGFRRLAIIDLSEHGHQPMRSATGRFTMSFNGEVFNFGELRAELEKGGARFRGHSDSEVMLAAFEAWGVERSLPRFVGMFAFALWDARDRVLHLARDRFGKKPLFVFTRPGFVSFGSELKALVAAPQFDKSLDHDAVAAYLRYLYVPAPRTIYRHVRKLEPGHLLTISDVRGAADGVVRPYWSVEEAARRGTAAPIDASDTEIVAEGDRLIRDAVRLRMISDVPLGAFLSGGIDSSTVVALMQASAPRPVRTFSVGFDEAEFDESAHAAAVARHLGTDHTEVRLTARDALGLVPQLPEWFDEPLADPSQLPTYLICREARREVTVAVSGDGGDEIFGGYNRYLFGERTIARASAVPVPLRRLGAAALGLLGAGGWDRAFGTLAPLMPRGMRQRLPGEKIAKLRRLLGEGSPGAMYRSLLAVQDAPERFLRGGRDPGGAVERIFAAPGSLGLRDQMMLSDQLAYLPDDLLAKVDRVSMAVSLEVRVPLLDHRVAEFGWRLPARCKIRDGESKWLLRRILDRYVPARLVERPKMGFSVPIDRWLRGELRSWGESLVSPERLKGDPLLEGDAVRGAWEGFQRGRGPSGLSIWALLLLQQWRERWAA